MTSIRLTLAAAFVAGAAGTASAGLQGIVFTSQQQNAVRFLDSTGSVSTLYASVNPDTRFANVTAGPTGELYVADGRLPFPNTTDAGILRVDMPFSGSASASYLTQGNPLQNPVGLTYDSVSGNLLTVSNPGSPVTGDTIDGIFSVSLSGATGPIFVEDNNATGVRFDDGFGLARANGSNDFFVTAVNGGSFDAGGVDGRSSTIWRMEYDAGSGDYALANDPAVDFADAFTGFGSDLTNIRGIATVPGSDSIWVTDFDNGSILRVDLASDGSFSSVSLVASNLAQPETIIYNPLTGKLVFSERGDLTDSRISSIAIDGSGYEVLLEGEHARGFYIVPAPGSAALMALAGFAATRRRR